MSDSCTRAKPSMAEPSNPIPSAKACSNSAGATATDLRKPSTSVNHSRTNRMSRSSSVLRTNSCCRSMIHTPARLSAFPSQSIARQGYAHMNHFRATDASAPPASNPRSKAHKALKEPSSGWRWLLQWYGLCGGVLLSRRVAPAVPSALAGLASGFGMGPGVSPPPWPPQRSPTVNTSPAQPPGGGWGVWLGVGEPDSGCEPRARVPRGVLFRCLGVPARTVCGGG